MNVSLQTGALAFPADRRVLNVREVAVRLRLTEQAVTDLIEEGALQALNVGGHARHYWRIPVEAYEAFLRARDSLGDGILPRKGANAATKPTKAP